MSTRLSFAVVALASIIGPSAAMGETVPTRSERVTAPRPLPPSAEGGGTAASLSLVWLDPAGVAAGCDGIARREAEGLLRRMGVSVSWRRGQTGELARPGEVRVIVLDRAATQETRRLVLGATPQRFAVSPFVWVHVPSVRAQLGLSPRPPAHIPATHWRALGLAVGRVVAHEVVHAVAPAVPHGTGLMAASLNLRQLTAPSIPFDSEVGLAVRSALRGEVTPPSPDTGVLAAAMGREEPVR